MTLWCPIIQFLQTDRLTDRNIIKSKKDLNEWLRYEKQKYPSVKPLYWVYPITEGDAIWRWQRRLRVTEYYHNSGKKVLYYISFVMLKRLSLKYGINIGVNCCGIGLQIMHVGSILLNNNVRCGHDCAFHINTAIVAGGTDDYAPVIGNNVVLGIGSTVLGNTYLADSIAVGAGAVVNKSFFEANIAVAGVPAKKVSNNGRSEWNKSRH